MSQDPLTQQTQLRQGPRSSSNPRLNGISSGTIPQQLRSHSSQGGQSLPAGSGIFFDMKKGHLYQNYEKKQQQQQQLQQRNRKTLNDFDNYNPTNTSLLPNNAATTTTASTTNPTQHPFDSNQHHASERHQQYQSISQSQQQQPTQSQSQKLLYSPFEYLHYTAKVANSKDNYMNSLTQLGYPNVNSLADQPYNSIRTSTENLIQTSYCLKYLGVIDGNMGILSKRLRMPALSSTQLNERGVLLHDEANSLSKADRPDVYNSYMITQYSLPKHLKPIVKPRSGSMEKQRLEQWHAQNLRDAQQIKSFNDTTAITNAQSPLYKQSRVNNNINNGSNSTTNILINSTPSNDAKLLPVIIGAKKRSNLSQSQRTRAKDSQQNKNNNNNNNASLLEAADQPSEALSYSRLLKKIQETRPSGQMSVPSLQLQSPSSSATQTNPQIQQKSTMISRIFAQSEHQNNTNSISNNNNKNLKISLEFTHNQALHQRFTNIAKNLAAVSNK